jgi:hypothetical protein
MLVNKPQFDPTEIKVGDAVILNINSFKKDYNNKTQYEKFSSGSKGLVISVHPLEVFILLTNKSEAKICVEDVANGAVTITPLIPRLEATAKCEVTPSLDLGDNKKIKASKTTRKIKDGSGK